MATTQSVKTPQSNNWPDNTISFMESLLDLYKKTMDVYSKAANDVLHEIDEICQCNLDLTHDLIQSKNYEDILNAQANWTNRLLALTLEYSKHITEYMAAGGTEYQHLLHNIIHSSEMINSHTRKGKSKKSANQ